MQDTSDEICLTSDINFGDEANGDREENITNSDEAEIILENMQYCENSDRDIENHNDFLEVTDESF